MPRCEDAPCCGCCGRAVEMADYYASFEREYDDDPYYEEF